MNCNALGGFIMFSFSQELNYDIDKENYVKYIQELFNGLSDNVVIDLNDYDNGYYKLESTFKREYNDHMVMISASVEFTKKILRSIKLCLEPEDKNDTTNYDVQLKLLYHEEIKSRLFDAVNQKKKKYTLRNYKFIYNSTPIYGFYKINGEAKIAFHSLFCMPKIEPMTEHIICFDIELNERNFEMARSSANNIATEFCDFLSVLLDLGFYEPSSKFVHFIHSRNFENEKVFFANRFRTAFWDHELNFLVQNNMNGLSTLEEAQKGNCTNGYVSLTFESEKKTIQTKYGNPLALEKAFCGHTIHSPANKTENQYRNGIDEGIHYQNSSIEVPREIRKYYRGIAEYKKKNYSNFKLFRNACRLYNKSKLLALDESTIEISFLVASLETLSHIEKGTRFSDFVKKYNPDADEKDLSDLYSIRSELFHSGNFSFFEYDFDINPYSNATYCEFQHKYIKYKSILRKAFVRWIQCNMLDFSNGENNS